MVHGCHRKWGLMILNNTTLVTTSAKIEALRVFCISHVLLMIVVRRIYLILEFSDPGQVHAHVVSWVHWVLLSVCKH